MKIYETLKKNRVLILAVAIAFVFGLFVAKHHYNKPFKEKVERDTVIIHDTIPDLNPTPKDSATIKYVTRYLPVLKTDTIMGATITHWEYIQTHDTVAAQVPITSKHYGSKDYDAWVSGYEPSLDSIFVYQKEVLVTERVIVSKPPNKLALFLNAGVYYTINDKKWYPHAGGELVLNSHKRIQFAIEGGVMKTPLVNGVNPYAGGKVKIRVF
jgi:hypothetical protein